MPLPAQPLEFRDFSGGITDNFLQGGLTRAQTIQNLFITNDKKLECRYGISLFETVAPVANQKLNNLYLMVDNETLLAQTARQLYVYDTGTFTAITGIGGHEPVEGGDHDSQNSYAEFQKQIYITNDESYPGTQPSKVYKNSTGAWTAKTAGLPQCLVAPNYTDASLLAKCIALANAIRTSMISHLNDSIGGQYGTSGTPATNSINLHRYIDKKALSYLVTQTFSASPAIDPTVPSPVPTAAAAATTEATLYTLVTALRNCYNAHLEDVIIPTTSLQWTAAGGSPYYHQNIYPGAIGAFYATPHGPHLPLAASTAPDAVVDAAEQLDDILLKWNLHRKSIWTHSLTNTPAQFDKYAPTETAVGTVHLDKTTPTIAPDYSQLYAYVNNLKRLYAIHTNPPTQSSAAGITQHSMRPNDVYGCDYTCYLPDCTDLTSMYALIYWLRQLYHLHYLDASNFSAARPGTAITFRTTAASKNITNILKTSDASTPTLVANTYIAVHGTIAAVNYNFSPPFYGATRFIDDTTAYLAKAPTTGSGTATLDVAATSTADGTTGGTWNTYYGFNSSSLFHVAVNPLIVHGAGATSVSPFIDCAIPLTGDSEALAVIQNDRGLSYPTQDGYDLSGWMGLASELFYALINHAANKSVHYVVSAALNFTYLPSQFIYNASLLSGFSNPFFIPTVSDVSYAFHWTDTYTVESGGLEYETRSNPIFSDPITIATSIPIGTLMESEDTDIYPSAISVYAATHVISNIPTLVNTTQSNYDTSNIKMNISRTTNGGTVYYLLDQVDNGTATFSDSVSDDLSASPLADREPLYTNGGVIGYDQPPLAKFLHNLNGTLYYGAITDTGQFFPQRIRQSVQFSPDSAPSTFYLDLDDNISGLSSTRSNLLAFCLSSVYRINGGFNNLGQGALTYDRLSDTIGAVNQKSIVQTDVGVFFAGGDGFYYTDGYQIIKISLEIDKTYAGLVLSEAQKRGIVGTYDKLNRRIWWGVRTSSTDSANSIVYVYYLNFGIKPSGTFTTVNSTSTVYDYFRPCSLIFKDGNILYGHEDGRVFTIDKSTKRDYNDAVPYNYTSCAVDAGTTFNRKWWTKLHLVGKNTGNASIAPYIISDLNATGNGVRAMTVFNYQENDIWGSPTHVWGDATKIWGAQGKIDAWRRFPSGSLRSDFIQIKFVPAEDYVVYSSSVFGLTCSSDGITTVSLDVTDYPDAVWPEEIANMELFTSYDNYATGYAIAGGGTANLIISGIPAASGLHWEIRGQVSQTPTITSFVLHYNVLGDKNQAYPGATSDKGGGNAGENP